MSAPHRYNRLPVERPSTPLLDAIKMPADVRALAPAALPTLADELRAFLLFTVARTGGHFGAGLGVVELTIALHHTFDTPGDVLLWDVGHQAYPHKILTGRRQQMATLRLSDGLAPFPSPDESEYDAFGVGHSSTSISAALGMAVAADLAGSDQQIVAVIGDGAMTAGMAYEALNHAATLPINLSVVFNDNAMSISPNTGGLARYLAGQGGTGTISALMAQLGFTYHGPVDGHDLDELVPAVTRVKAARGLQFLHVITTKGRGYAPAEQDPVASHALTKIEPLTATGASTAPPQVPAPTPSQKKPLPSFAQLFGQWACATAGADPRCIAITPAMREGSGLTTFSETYPDRFFDVAIAEQHAVTFAAGLASAGLKPVVAIYSTFLQRAYDQLIHDVAIQNLDVTFAIDRAGLVEDGPTHAGVFDLAFMRCIPNLSILAPADGADLTRMLNLAYTLPGPSAVRYPRGAALPGLAGAAPDTRLASATVAEAIAHLPARWLRRGGPIAILSFGTMLHIATEVAASLDASLLDMRWVKPLDIKTLQAVMAGHRFLVTLEEHAMTGGAGSAVAEQLYAAENPPQLLTLGIPDAFVAHGSISDQMARCELRPQQIVERVRRQFAL